MEKHVWLGGLEMTDSPPTRLDSSSIKNYNPVVNLFDNRRYLFVTNHSTVNSDNYFNQAGSSVGSLVNHEEKYLDGPDFNYTLNEYGFRSKKFSEFNKNNTNILFLGCSITQGVGLPEESTWYKKLINKISNENPSKKIDFYNISMSGIGVHTIIKNLIVFLNQVGKPDYIFGYMPDSNRSLLWDKDQFHNFHYRNNLNEDFPEREIAYSKNIVIQDLLMRDTTLLHLLELICSLGGIKLIWSTWPPENQNFYNATGFNNYFLFYAPIEDLYVQPNNVAEKIKNDFYYEKKEYDFKLKQINKKNKNNEPYWSSARDGMHYGSFYSEFVADKFFKEFKNRYEKI